jgi:hypothetical protein
MIAIDLNDEPQRNASKVHKIRSNGMLSAKIDAFHPMAANGFPADTFGEAGIAAQFPCSLGPLAHAPSPNLSP